MTKPKPKLHKRTIAKELLAQWQKLKRQNDPEELVKILEVSKPTIDKALTYGCVHQQKIIDGINEYFASRLMREKDKAGELERLQEHAA